MSVIYRVDAVKRTNVPNHLQTLEDLNILDRVLAHDACRGRFNRFVSEDDTRPPDIDAPVHALPTVLAKGMHFAKKMRFAADYYLRRFVNDAEAFICWSGMSPFTLERANELGMETYVVRASSHIAESQKYAKMERDRFGVETSFSRINTATECYEYQLADHIITPSEYTARSFERYGIDSSKVHVVPYECDLRGVTDVPDRTPDDTFTVCTATTVGPMRGVQYLLLAWEQFAADKDDVHLRIAGGKADNFPEQIYDQFDSRDDVTFEGYINDVASLYSESHAFVLPSLYDGGPCGPLEAMSTGTPAIVSETMGAEMDVDDGETGFVVPTRDEDAIADRLERLYNDQSLRESMAQQARNHASSVPGREREELEALFREFAE